MNIFLFALLSIVAWAGLLLVLIRFMQGAKCDDADMPQPCELCGGTGIFDVAEQAPTITPCPQCTKNHTH